MYHFSDEGIFRGHGESDQITNFTAEITHQIIVHDGMTKMTTLMIQGQCCGKKMPPIEVPAEQFAAMAWIPRLWGIEPIIMPVGNAERDARAAIQMASKPKSVNVYKHTGWTKIEKKPVYLHGGGSISEKGNDPKTRVELPADLSRFRLEPDSERAMAAFRSSLDIRLIGPLKTMWPLILTTYRAAIGPADFGLHLAGKTGTFKTEICALMQSHYGPGMDSRSLPGSWSSTANALEAQAFFAKNAVLVVDDFVPSGTAWQVRTLQKTADQLMRGQGNQQGRARLSDRTTLQQTYYPRGIIMSTGEDIPEGHSIRARMVILELSPGDINVDSLTESQNDREHFSNAMAHYIGWLALNYDGHMARHKQVAIDVRDKNRDLGHARTPAVLGQLYATLERILEFGVEMNFLSTGEAETLRGEATNALGEMAEEQSQYLEEADPADAFVQTIRQVLSGHLAHIKTVDGATPEVPEMSGWTVSSGPGGLPDYRSHGPQIGWTDWGKNHLLIDINSLMFLKRHAAGKLSMTRHTLLRRLKDAAILTRTEESRKRNTIRATCEGHVRTVICIDLKQTLDQSDA